MVLEIFNSAVEFGSMMFSLLVVITIFQFMLWMKDTIVGLIESVITPIVNKAKFKKAAKGNIAWGFANAIYLTIVMIGVIFMVSLFIAPVSTPSNPPSGESLWNVLITLLPVVILYKTVIYFKDEIVEMGNIVKVRR